jgi:hypothetical protein
VFQKVTLSFWLKIQAVVSVHQSALGPRGKLWFRSSCKSLSIKKACAPAVGTLIDDDDTQLFFIIEKHFCLPWMS